MDSLTVEDLPRFSDADREELDDDYTVTPALISDEAIAVRDRARALPTVAELLTQALTLLDEADEANHRGHLVTFELQRQACEVLDEAIDELASEQ